MLSPGNPHQPRRVVAPGANTEACELIKLVVGVAVCLRLPSLPLPVVLARRGWWGLYWLGTGNRNGLIIPCRVTLPSGFGTQLPVASIQPTNDVNVECITLARSPEKLVSLMGVASIACTTSRKFVLASEPITTPNGPCYAQLACSL